MTSMDEWARRLAAWHSGRGELVDREGMAHPVVTEPLAAGSTAQALRVHDGEADIDARLAEAGESHLQAIAARAPGLHDGSVLVLERIEGDVLHVTRSGYFAMLRTCDALIDELERAGDDTDPAGLPMRARAHELAGGRPLELGTGRAAAVGVSAVVTTMVDGRPGFVIGRRRADLAADPGKWHVAPSGMVEPSDDGDPLGATTRAELREELGTGLTGSGPPRVLGVAHDLRRLRPEMCLRIDVAGGLRLPGSTGEFESFEIVPLDEMPRFWREHGPDRLTPAAAGALALLEASA